MKGEAVSAGIAFGNVFILEQDLEVKDCSIKTCDTALEIERFQKGRQLAAEHLERLVKKVLAEMGEDKAEIFEGHLEILTSEDVEEEVTEIIEKSLVCAEEAIRIFAETNAQEMEELDDDYFKERGQDFRDIGKQLIKGVTGKFEDLSSLPPDTIIVSQELTPSQTAAMDMKNVRGLLVHTGGVNSHAAIIARSREIPAIIVRDTNPEQIIRNGDKLIIDGFTGDFWINPNATTTTKLKKKQAKKIKERETLLQVVSLPSVTADGKKVGLYANVGGLHDVESANRYHADGIGLFRSEFLFMESSSSPSLAHQVEVYKAAVTAMGGKNVIIRLLDTGADKPLPYWQLPQEDNPFLGVRGIRLLFEKEDILRTQIQAMLIASEAGPLGMMIPMVASLKPIQRIHALIDEEKRALDWKGPDNLTLGVMIETPAAVQLIEEILEIVDFVSIGTNDLTQYTLAADRGNPLVDLYYDEFHPAVLRSIAHVIKKANKAGKLNGICGELAGNPLVLPYFVGLGVQELSATPVKLPDLKYILREIKAEDAQELVKEVLRIPTSDGIRARLNRFLQERDLLR